VIASTILGFGLGPIVRIGPAIARRQPSGLLGAKPGLIKSAEVGEVAIVG
jgi:hypothetical protein